MQVFCLPYAGSSAVVYHSWKNKSKFSIVPIEYPGHGSKIKENLFFDVNELSILIADEIKQKVKEDYIIYGHSLGSLVALHAAQYLSPKFLVVSGRGAPHTVPKFSYRGKASVMDLSEGEFLNYIEEEYRPIPKEIKFNSGMLEIFLRILRADFATLATYDPARKPMLNIPIKAVAASQDLYTPEIRMLAWKDYTSSTLENFILEGDHFNIISNPDSLIKIIES